MGLEKSDTAVLFGKEVAVRFLQVQLQLAVKPATFTFPFAASEAAGAADTEDFVRTYVLRAHVLKDLQLRLIDRRNKKTNKSSFLAVYRGEEYVLDGSM